MIKFKVKAKQVGLYDKKQKKAVTLEKNDTGDTDTYPVNEVIYLANNGIKDTEGKVQYAASLEIISGGDTKPEGEKIDVQKELDKKEAKKNSK